MLRFSKNILHRIARAIALGGVFVSIVFLGLLYNAPSTSPSDTPLPIIETPPQLHDLGKIAPAKQLDLIWPTPDIERMKREGCVADGLLSGFNKPRIDIALAHDSHCYYFHRAVETWLHVPDFTLAHNTIKKINRPDALYGMFIAEAIDTKSDYFYREKNRPFRFKDMCKRHSKNYWGEHTCKPSLAREEYRAYLKQITQDAMDSGIQVFLFGQIRHQEDDIQHPKVDNVIRQMRAYAAENNMAIIIGAQTGDITQKRYLHFFDFIEGGIGLHDDGTIESGPCFSKYFQKDGDWCWPLLWHEQYTKHAHHVFTYLDWNGQIGDDMNTFVRLSTPLRHRVLQTLYTTFTSQDIGFLLPLLTPLPKDPTGCHGPRKSFYSPHMDYGCPDMDTINAILETARKH